MTDGVKQALDREFDTTLNRLAAIDQHSGDPEAEIRALLGEVGIPEADIETALTASDDVFGAFYNERLDSVVSGVNSAFHSKIQVIANPEEGTGAQVVEGTPLFTRFHSTNSQMRSTLEKLQAAQDSHHPVFGTPPEFDKMSMQDLQDS